MRRRGQRDPGETKSDDRHEARDERITQRLRTHQPRTVSLSTLYDGYRLPLDAAQISSTLPLSAALNVTQTQALTRSGFVVAPARYASFSALYAEAGSPRSGASSRTDKPSRPTEPIGSSRSCRPSSMGT